MQHIQQLDPLPRQQPALSPLRIALLRPSVWERMKAWTRRTYTKETVAEITFGALTIVLAVWLFTSFSLALQNYTIIPLP